MMVGFITGRIEENRALSRLGTDAIPSSTEEVVAASAEDAFVRNPTPSLYREARRSSMDAEGIRGEFNDDPTAPRLMEPDEANERFGIEGKLKFDRATTEAVAEELNQLKRDELRREDVFRRAQGGAGQWAARIGTGLAVSILDPLNVASAFLPVVGPSRYALWLERAGSTLGRAGVRVGVGALEGAAGAAVLEPLVLGVARSEQADYGMADSMLNIAFGSVLGGGLHAGAGAIGDRITGRFARQVEEMPIAEREGALRVAIAQVAEGRPVDVEAFFLRQELLSSTTLSRTGARLTSDALPTSGGVDVAPEPRVLLPVAERDAGYVRYDTESEAARGAARLERRTGDTIEVRPMEDGTFILARQSAAEPVRNPDGTALTFPNERQAHRYIAQQINGEKVDIVAVGPAGKREFAIIRGASDQDLRAIKAEPGLVALGRAEDGSAAASIRADQAKAAERQSLARADMERVASRAIRQGVAGWIDADDLRIAGSIPPAPKSVTPEMAREQTGKDVDMSVEKVSQAIKEAEASGRLTEGDLKTLSEADDMVKRADAMGRAAQAAGACLAGRP